MQANIHSTIEPDNPITDFNSWYQYIITAQEEQGEIRRYKRDIEASFNDLHKSITESNYKRDRI